MTEHFPNEYREKLHCVCEFCRIVLVYLVKDLCKRHQNAFDPDVVLANLLASNPTVVNRNHSLKGSKESGKITTHLVQTSSLDITGLCCLVLSRELNLLESRKCCNNCKHTCACPDTTCRNLIECQKQPCTGCDIDAKDCPYVICERCAVATRIARNTFSHSTDQDFAQFQARQHKFPMLSSANTWKELWQLINNSVEPCMKLLYDEDNSLEDVYKDFVMDMRIVLRKSRPDVFKLLYENILTNFTVTKTVSKEIFIHNGKEISYNDEKHERKRATVEYVMPGGCRLNCKVQAGSTFLQVQVRSDADPSWNNVEYKRMNDDDSVIELRELNENINTSVRVLVFQPEELEEGGTQYVIVECDGLIISDEPDSELFEVGEGITKYVSSDKHQQIAKSAIRNIINGIIVKFPNQAERMELLLIKKCSYQMKCWEVMEGNQTEYDDNSAKLVISDLEEEKHSFKIAFKPKRVHITDTEGNRGDEIQIFSIVDADVVGWQELQHVTVNARNSVTVMCHPYGQPSDVHQNIRDDYKDTWYNTLDFTNIIYYKGGNISDNLSKAPHYLNTYFSKEVQNGEVIKFPPDSHTVDGKTFRNQVCDQIERFYKDTRFLSEHPIIILRDYSTKKHLSHIEAKPSVCEVNHKIKFAADDSNRIVVFDRSLEAVINIRLAVHTSNETAMPYSKIEDAFQECHNDLKTLFIFHCDIIKTGRFKLVGIVATNGLERPDVEEQHFCDDARCKSMVLTDDELNNGFYTWWENLCSMIDDMDEGKGRMSTKTRDNFMEVPNRMMVMISLEHGDLPCVFASEHENINNLLWSKDQMEAISRPFLKKIILGAYGSGKSLVAQKLMKNFLQNPNNHGNLYVITWDEYSLLFVSMEEYYNKLAIEMQKNKINIVCTNIVDISEGRKDLFTLSGLFEHLEGLHDGQPVHVLLDEVDPEKLREEDVVTLNSLMQRPTYKDSTLVIVLQSLDKERTINNDITQSFDLKTMLRSLTSFHVHQLRTTMRCTNKLHAVIESSQDSIRKENVNIYQQSSTDKKSNLVLDPPQDPAPPSPTDNKNQQTTLAYLAKKSPETVQCIDKLARLANTQVSQHTMEEEKKNVMTTRFTYQHAEECGTNIDGSLPLLVRLEEDVSLRKLASAIHHFIRSFDRQALFICNKDSLVQKIKITLKELKKQYVEYLHHTEMGKYPTSHMKRKVYKQWKEKNCILITDNRGICGLQHEKVVVFFDENEYYERYLWPEAVSRTTTQLYLVSFQSETTQTKYFPTTTNVINSLIKRKFVKEIKFESDIKLIKLMSSNVPSNIETNIRMRKPSKQEASGMLNAKFEHFRGNQMKGGNTDQQYTELGEMLKSQNIGRFSDMIKQNPALAKIRNDFGNDLSHLAAMYDCPDAIRVLYENGCDYRKNTDGGWTAFHWAALQGSYKVMEELIRYYGDRINDPTAAGLTPIQIAAKQNRHEIVELLRKQPNIVP